MTGPEFETGQDRWERRVIGLALLFAVGGGSIGMAYALCAVIDMAQHLALTGAGGLTVSIGLWRAK